MLTLDAREFVELLHVLLEAEQRVRGHTGPVTDTFQAVANTGIAETIERLKKLDLPVSIKTAEQMCVDPKKYEDMHRGLTQLNQTVMLELDGRKFYGPLRRFEQYFEQPKLFGDAVFSAFPSANNDISEAGTCLALERGTACVMHCMRAAESGLKALAGVLGVQDQADWGGYLRKIDETLEARAKAAGKRTPDEQFYAEARVTIDGVRIAWRNPTMHTENNYSPERAEEILIAVRALMRHLSGRVSEQKAELERLLG